MTSLANQQGTSSNELDPDHLGVVTQP